MSAVVVFCLFFSVVMLVFLATVFYYTWANGLHHEKKMLPCPKCGHKAITIHYLGENDPWFYTAECGAYERRETMRHVSGTCVRNGCHDNKPEMTDKQKECMFCAGYCADVPHFATRLGAVLWWNRKCRKEGL